MKLIALVDDSPESREVLEKIEELAGRLEASVELVHVVQPSPESGVVKDVNSAHEEGKRILSEASKSISMKVSTTLLTEGERVADRVSEYVEEGDFDIALVGHRRFSRKEEEAFGSVAKELLRKSPVPVLVVPRQST